MGFAGRFQNGTKIFWSCAASLLVVVATKSKNWLVRLTALYNFAVAKMSKVKGRGHFRWPRIVNNIFENEPITLKKFWNSQNLPKDVLDDIYDFQDGVRPILFLNPSRMSKNVYFSGGK